MPPSYGVFIKAVRRSAGLSQIQLAEIIGVDQPNMSAYENDRQLPSVDMLNRIVVGCGYLLEAVAGERRFACPLPDFVYGGDQPWEFEPGPATGAAPASDDSTSSRQLLDPERQAQELELVLGLADDLRASTAAP